MLIGHKKNIEDLRALTTAGTLSHGYIFFGPAMIGKSSVAEAFAYFLEKGTFEAPGSVEILQDMKRIDPAAGGSIGIDEIREIKHFLWQKPNTSARRTLIIAGAEMLTNEAQNALLKVTEEPPASSLLILVTSDIESILPTIASRLPKIYFGPVPEKEIAGWLAAERGITKIKAAPFAERAFGKPGLALRLASDEHFMEQLNAARDFLKTTPAGRKEFIKKLLDPEDFKLRTFLEAVIMNLAWETPSKASAARWHKALALYESTTNFGLNPRLQLENLLR